MKKIALFTFLTLLLCTSCVTKKKFMMTEAARIASIDSLQSLLTDCRNTGDQLSAQIKKLLRDTTQMETVSVSIRACLVLTDGTGKTECLVESEEKRT